MEEMRECGWRPIETAPKDGRPILVWWAGQPTMARYSATTEYVYETVGWGPFRRQKLIEQRGTPAFHAAMYIARDAAWGIFEKIGPTHWMPLPESPE